LFRNGNRNCFCDAGKWTSTPAEARDFKTTLNAIAFCLQHDLRNTEVLVHFGHGETKDVIVPVDETRERLRPSGNTASDP
jgi:hypothetical protein